MTLGTSTLLIGGAIGLGLAVFGLRMVVKGRGPAGILRNFPEARAAGPSTTCCSAWHCC